MDPQRPPRKERTTIAFENLRISGPFSLSEEGELQVEGLLEGDVTCHALIVPPGGTVKGRIRADWVVIQGNFCGSIETSVFTASQDAVVIGGQITVYEKVLLEPGCLFHGDIVRPGQDEETPDRGFARTEATETAARLAAQTVASWSFKEGNTALIEAIGKGDLEIADRLLTAGADPDAAAPDGLSALTLAVQEVRVEIAIRLLAAGANPNRAAADGATPLLLATQRGSASLAEALLAGGADANLVCSDGSTPLIEAARLGRTEIVRALLHAGADLEHRNAAGEMPMLLAQQRGYQETLELLRQAAVGGLAPPRTAEPEPETAAEPEPEAAAEPEPVTAAPEPEAAQEPEPEAQPEAETAAEELPDLPAAMPEPEAPVQPQAAAEAVATAAEAEAAEPVAPAPPETEALEPGLPEAEDEAAASGPDADPPAAMPPEPGPAELALTPPPSDRRRREAAESILADLAPAPEPPPDPGPPPDLEASSEAAAPAGAGSPLPADEEPQAAEAELSVSEPVLAQPAGDAESSDGAVEAPGEPAEAGPNEPFLRMPPPVPDAPAVPEEATPEPAPPAILEPAEIESLSEAVMGLLAPFTIEEARAPLDASEDGNGGWHLSPRDQGVTARAARPKDENGGGQVLLVKHGQAEGAVPAEIELRQLAPGEAPEMEDLQPAGEIRLSLLQPDPALVYWPIHFRRIVLHGGRQAGDYVCDVDGNWSKSALQPAIEA